MFFTTAIVICVTGFNLQSLVVQLLDNEILCRVSLNGLCIYRFQAKDVDVQVKLDNSVEQQDVLLDKIHRLEGELKEVSEKYADLVGHHNTKQKIKHLVDLKHKNEELTQVGIFHPFCCLQSVTGSSKIILFNNWYQNCWQIVFCIMHVNILQRCRDIFLFTIIICLYYTCVRTVLLVVGFLKFFV